MLGQDTGINFSDIKSLENTNDFLKLVIDKGFGKVSDSDVYPNPITYALNYNKQTQDAEAWAVWYEAIKAFSFRFSLEDGKDLDYENIIKSIQSNCKFYNVVPWRTFDEIKYLCSNTEFVYIHYYIDIESGYGVIKTTNRRW